MRKKIFACLSLFMMLNALCINAQRIETVSKEYSIIVRDNEAITFGEAKRKCIEMTKAEAIKEVFGEIIASDVVIKDSDYWENTVAMAKGTWLGDTESPVLDIVYKDGLLVFTAKVKGEAREITQATTDLKWEVKKEGINGKVPASTFDSGERFYVDFRSPADGYVAVYLTETGSDETSCLLPYPKDADGRFPIKANRDYTFFDKSTDELAPYYRFKTKRSQERVQLIIIYSPNPFTKCNDVSKGKLRPNSLSSSDFQKWLLKCLRMDSDMVVNKKWVDIINKEQQ